MPTSIFNRTLVLVLDRADDVLRTTATVCSWRIRGGRPLDGVVRDLLLNEPDTVVIQVNGRGEAASGAILAANVRELCQYTRLCAWSVEYEPQIEQTMRSVGLHVYLAGRSGLHLLQTICSGHQTRAGPPTGVVSTAEDLPPPVKA